MIPLPAPRPIELAPGESLFFHSEAGSTLLAASGTLLVTDAPRWLGEQVLRSRAVVQPGQAHTFLQGGWVTLTAQHGGAVGSLQPLRAEGSSAWRARLACSTRALRRLWDNRGRASRAPSHHNARPV